MLFLFQLLGLGCTSYATITRLVPLEHQYRRALWTMISHGANSGACLMVASILKCYFSLLANASSVQDMGVSKARLGSPRHQNRYT
ncbi:hypothetical protein F4815DRAFT_489863 [Daldinia loculata]|nr:hypothetical protein F4815DRAFT_489863 [Daldinia loculata]